MEEKIFLSDDQVDELVEVAESANNDNDSIQTLRQITNGDFDPSVLDDMETEEKDVAATINPFTGKSEGTAIASGYGMGREEDIFDDFLGNENVEIDDISTQDILSNVKKSDIGSISDSDAERVKELLFKRNSGEAVKYADLPDFLKKKVDEETKSVVGMGLPSARFKEVRNAMATSTIEQIYMELVSDKIEQVCVDLDTSIKNMAKSEIGVIDTESRKMYHNTFVNQFPELAGKYKDNNPEKAELLLKISDGYSQAYSLEKMYKAYTSGKIKVKKIDIEKLSRLVNEFNMKYEKATLTVRDISTAPVILDRHVNKCYPNTAIKAFIVVFCKYTMNMKPDNIDEHTFMYYFINNILSLDLYDPNVEDDKKYYETFVDNINKFLDAITIRMNLLA